MNVPLLWSAAIMISCLYCFARGVMDVRNHRYVLGLLGIMCGIAILFAPGQAVTITMPCSGCATPPEH